MENWATKERFFKCPVPREKETIEGIGDIWIYGLTSGEKDEYENDVIQVTTGSRRIRMANARAVLIQRTVRDQHGKLMFAAGDIGRINQIPAAVLDPIYDKARKLSAMQSGSTDEVEELVKNSEKLQALSSGTDSPDTSDAPNQS